MQLTINILAHLALAATVLGAVLPAKPGFTSHEVTKPDGSKDVLYLRSDFVSTDADVAASTRTTSGLVGRSPAPPANVPFTAEDMPVANCPIDMSAIGVDNNAVPIASLSDCQALMAAMDQKSGYWATTNWHAMYTLATVGTCKFSCFRWDGGDGELKVGNLDLWSWLDVATGNFSTNDQIHVNGNGPCGGESDTNIRFDIGDTKY
ncbi:hypothetical protein PG994_000379 [Apiospora phragmitis]|uniref:Ecp2 effector protein-like domain-containing protein n=1 Tax=Apiospora phragmitis TaxID=2905665 RepID=A0ABR1X6A2_9PEZI